ncbi:alpha/beta fold hydrolase [Herbaspirillum sp. alder98]|uniref:alpha/beta fold hydrolase n=1 Tax=Herbaspirillum sp. alder98 TaxID=2913096 RepID=UPI001CD83873|nr:alpha/beta hydrolase [Herbaspirillum sp. alder98]MCA1327111.1 alpha/beta hydrolase [Herbaspirillum sp. alder98]
MSFTSFSLQVDDECVACDVLGASPVQTLVLHGAGQSSRQRQQPLRQTLADLGCASAALDFSGHGASTSHQPASLEKRLEQAQALLDHATTGPRTVVGVSMGGEIALRLACRAQNQITHVVTIVGAIYDGSAFALPFGPAFSAALRRHESWRDAEVLQLLATYTGRLTLVRALDDAVIPYDVADLVRDHARASRHCCIVDLPSVDHRISERCANDHALRHWLAQLIANPPA